jgi:hypothetical protein
MGGPSPSGETPPMTLRLAALLATLALPVSAQVQLIEAGIICPRIVSGEMVEAPDTEVGAIRMIDQALSFDLDARKVPTITNLGFGFRVALEPGIAEQDITIVVTHPPMGERGVTRQAWRDRLVAGETNMNLFTFEFDYEKVPGLWTFSVEVDGEAVVSVPFEVAAEDARGPVEAACFQFMS